MRFVALVSGGKDSIYSIVEAIRNGHEFVACLHMGAPSVEEEESYMYQTAASEVVRTLVEDCLDVPLLLYQRVGTSQNTSLIYDHEASVAVTNTNDNTNNNQEEDEEESGGKKNKDEIEDLFSAIEIAKNKFKVDAVCSGAILSTYQRVRIENVCNRLGLTSLSYLWRLLPQKQLLPKMLDDGIEAVVVKTACPPGLMPRRHLNKTLRYLWDSGILERLHKQYQFHVCGEGGEYESLVIDSPIHKRKLVFDEVEIVESDNDDGIGVLRIPKCHAEEKHPDNDIPIMPEIMSQKSMQQQAIDEPSTASEKVDQSHPIRRDIDIVSPPVYMITLPHVKMANGGLLHISELYSSINPAATHDRSKNAPPTAEAQLAVSEANEIFDVLRRNLQSFDAKPTDVMFVHLYLSEISHFANINKHYQNFFGTLLPPSRSCVAVGRNVLPGGRRVLLDCIVQLGSGEYMRYNGSSSSSTMMNEYAKAAQATKTSKLRDVLHVQSISHWAPVCVGPYSQVNTLRSCLHFLAGQIGLVPATMELQPTWTMQLQQCWKNVAAVLDALEASSLHHLFSSLIYVSHDVYMEEGSLKLIESISAKQIRDNGTIIPGQIEPPPGFASSGNDDEFGGYEDQGTWEEMKAIDGGDDGGGSGIIKPSPTLLVCIPEMPKGAVVEVEVVAVTEKVASNLEMKDFSTKRQYIERQRDLSPLGWNTGHTFPATQQTFHEQIHLYSCARSIGHRCAANVFVVATTAENSASSLSASDHMPSIGIDALLQDMLSSVDKVLAEGRSGLNSADTMHVRLYYIATKLQKNIEEKAAAVSMNDGSQLRSALGTAIGAWATSSQPPNNTSSIPSASVIPVAGLSLMNSAFDMQNEIPFLALHVTSIDPVHFETERWINSDREYNT